MARVSVLMPMKNTARYVRDAVTSVLSQDFRDVELVVVDDASTDGSRAVVESIRDRRIRLLAGQERGVSAAWNVGLAVATGEVLMQCDSDDLYPQGRIARQLRFLDAHPEFGAVCGPFSTMTPSGRNVADLWADGDQAEEITQELLGGHTRTHLCAFAIRTEHLRALGGKREYFESAEDLDLQLRLAERCRIWYEPYGAYRYRLHDASVTHTQPSSRRQFFEQYARDLRRQRATGKPDDLQRGEPLDPPEAPSPPDRSGEQLRGMLIGEAWRQHRRGDRLAAIVNGLRALAHSPTTFEIWKSVAALLFKPSSGATSGSVERARRRRDPPVTSP
jgi:glycosyltransferase involved in cell wall biosynthesis